MWQRFLYIPVGNIAAQTQVQQTQAPAQVQAQSGAGNPTTMVPNPPGSVPIMTAGAASLAAALIKGQQQQQQAGKKDMVWKEWPPLDAWLDGLSFLPNRAWIQIELAPTNIDFSFFQ